MRILIDLVMSGLAAYFLVSALRSGPMFLTYLAGTENGQFNNVHEDGSPRLENLEIVISNMLYYAKTMMLGLFVVFLILLQVHPIFFGLLGFPVVLKIISLIGLSEDEGDELDEEPVPQQRN